MNCPIKVEIKKYFSNKKKRIEPFVFIGGKIDLPFMKMWTYPYEIKIRENTIPIIKKISISQVGYTPLSLKEKKGFSHFSFSFTSESDGEDYVIFFTLTPDKQYVDFIFDSELEGHSSRKMIVIKKIEREG